MDSVPAMSLERLQSAPVTLDVPLTTPSLGTYLWRDFMPTPTPTPNQDLLRIVVTLTETAETPIPATVSLAYVWVIKDHEVWSSTLDEIRADFTLQGIASGGPRWETGSDVDVVVGIKVDKSLRLVRVPKQTINATF
ncbi:MAG TPA: hypothetical protein VFH88_14305 [Candidatus Krumholzibacteria bacterium]|nr:hypothetical protein [Candidatus Krumholzibacteria bacterium]